MEFGIQETLAYEIRDLSLWNLEHRSRNLQSRKADFLESGIHWNGILNPVPGTQSLHHGIQNPRLSRIILHGVMIFKLPGIMEMNEMMNIIVFR